MQVNRLMEMIFVLLSHEKVTAQEFATRFQVSVRTIYRDVDILSLANIPVIMNQGKNGGISLLKSYKLDKALLTESEKQEVLSSLAIFGSLAPENSKSFEKLKAIFGRSDDWLEIDFDNWSNEEEQKELFTKVKQAILNKKQINFQYYSVNERTQRNVLPLKLCFKGQAWYLYAFCLTKKDYRFFKLNRIKSINILSIHFNLAAIPNVLESLPDYPIDKIDLTLLIAKEKAYRVYDEFKDITILDSGDFLINCKFPSGDWLYQYLATFLGDCKVIKPKEVQEKMVKIYQKMVKNSY